MARNQRMKTFPDNPGLAGLVAGLMACLVIWSAPGMAGSDTGETLYRRHCESCHGMDGRGLMPGIPDLTRPEALMVPDSIIIQVIENGSGTMPAFLGVIRPAEMRALIGHMRTLIR